MEPEQLIEDKKSLKREHVPNYRLATKSSKLKNMHNTSIDLKKYQTAEQSTSRIQYDKVKVEIDLDEDISPVRTFDLMNK